MEQKISKYSTATIVSLLCLLFSLPLQAQQQRPGARPAVKQKAKEEIKADTIPFYNGTYVGVDLFGLGSKLLGGDFLSSEVNVRVNLKKKFMEKYICTVCDYVYDPELGDPENGIEPGTSFEDLPEDWVCPLCGVGKEEFEKAS